MRTVAAGLSVVALPLASSVVFAESGPILSYGSEGQTVKNAESDLKTLGYYNGPIDGIFGPEMLRAVKAFQFASRIEADGIIGPVTWSSLNRALAQDGSSASPAYEAPAGIYREGDTGAEVRVIQTLLNEHGAHLAVDGDFGPLTRAAVEAFQAAQHITVDGIVGPVTMARLQDAPTSNAAALPVQASPPAYPSGYLHEGDQGPQVAQIQSDLARLGYYHGAIDGVFGPETDAAVVAFQQAVGLPAHGLVGSLTENALARALGQGQAAAAASSTVSRGVTGSAEGEAIAGYALQFVGYRYLWGGASPATGFDCSGLVQYVFGHFGIYLPHSSYAQFNIGTHVTMSELQPGDLVFFDADGPGASHVAIYVGNGEIVSADTPAQGVQVHNINDPFWVSHFLGGTQIVP
ncbi:MAG: peptidoglycan-binding protein [Firmicutes bacterium]|nr:peptidoglycan-binding protein [Bacillota bacterium]